MEVWSPVFIPDKFPISSRSASVTYLLFIESLISAVVAATPFVTSPLLSKVILVYVPPTIGRFSSILPSNSVCKFITSEIK